VSPQSSRRGRIVRRRSTWVAWSMLALFLASYGLGIPLSVARGHLLQDSTFILTFAAFMAVGAVIVAHRPSNAIGWISRPSVC
jgi:hypothetical protein